MLNKITDFIRREGLIRPGDRVICAVSGGADSVALLFGLYLLKDKFPFQLEAAHFNHNLRGAESQRDAAFVQDLCARYDIPLHLGSGLVQPGKKGLEAAAREARYGFLRSLPGKIATAHTADDNAETLLLHLIRGTGLRGLGGIAPISGRIIRPMLTVTRQEVEAFLQEWCLTCVQDSSNDTDAFLRNRIRHHVMPLLKAENPRFSENLSAMAMRLRLDEEYLSGQIGQVLPSVSRLRAMEPALRSRALESFLKQCGVREPEQTHLAAAEALVFSSKPSARASFPGGITIARSYDRLEALQEGNGPESVILSCPGEENFGRFRVTCTPAVSLQQPQKGFTVCPVGQIRLRSRQPGDEIRLPGGTKSLKKLFIDRKIPAAQRQGIPVACDAAGILGVGGFGVNLDRAAQQLPAVTICFEEILLEER